MFPAESLRPDEHKRCNPSLPVAKECLDQVVAGRPLQRAIRNVLRIDGKFLWRTVWEPFWIPRRNPNLRRFCERGDAATQCKDGDHCPQGSRSEFHRATLGVGYHFLRLFELARVLVRFDHVASFIVNANHGIMSAAASKLKSSWSSPHPVTLVPPCVREFHSVLLSLS